VSPAELERDWSFEDAMIMHALLDEFDAASREDQ
jgi:hypothetical protein